jgi:hypothetical protein
MTSLADWRLQHAPSLSSAIESKLLTRRPPRASPRHYRRATTSPIRAQGIWKKKKKGTRQCLLGLLAPDDALLEVGVDVVVARLGAQVGAVDADVGGGPALDKVGRVREPALGVLQGGLAEAADLVEDGVLGPRAERGLEGEEEASAGVCFFLVSRAPCCPPSRLLTL